LKILRKTPTQRSIINPTDTTDTTDIPDTTNTRTGAKIDLDLDLDRLDVLSGHLGLGAGLPSAVHMDLLGAVIVGLLNALRMDFPPVEVQDEDEDLQVMAVMVPGASFPMV
jgi:hypothetical protein